jgi:hypothetical protein
MAYEVQIGMTPYKGIPDILDARRVCGEDDGFLVDALGRVLLSQGVSDVVGVCLLHTHFELAFDELLVETLLSDHIVSTPRRVGSIKEPLYPIIWRVSEDGAVPLHWRVGHDSHSERIIAFINGNGGREFKNVLGGERNRLGLIRACHPERTRPPTGSAWMENTYDEERKLISQIVSAETVPSSSIQTAWFFRPSGQGLTSWCEVWCPAGKDGHAGPKHSKR